VSGAAFSPTLPRYVAFVALGPEAEPEPLLPEEETQLNPTAVEGRRRNFRMGRTAARRALDVLGVGPAPILRGANREPLWPDGFVGSITHAAGFAMAAVAHESGCAGIGIDLEHRTRFFPELERYIAFEEERQWLDELSGERRTEAVLELFSAKESIYKAFFPRVQRFFGFEAARLAPPSAIGRRDAWLSHDLDEVYRPGRRFPVGVEWVGDLVLTSVVLDGGGG
jgi:4'-phosphopantetheinyl transferase EntD